MISKLHAGLFNLLRLRDDRYEMRNFHWNDGVVDKYSVRYRVDNYIDGECRGLFKNTELVEAIYFGDAIVYFKNDERDKFEILNTDEQVLEKFKEWHRKVKNLENFK